MSPARRAGVNVICIGFPLCSTQKGPQPPRRFAPELLLFYRISFLFCSKKAKDFPGASRRNCHYFIGFHLYFAQKGPKSSRRFAPELPLFYRIPFVFCSKRPKIVPGASRRNCNYFIGFSLYFAQKGPEFFPALRAGILIIL